MVLLQKNPCVFNRKIMKHRKLIPCSRVIYRAMAMEAMAHLWAIKNGDDP